MRHITVAVLVLLAAPAAPALAAPFAPERLLLDTRVGEAPGAAGPVTSARPLKKGVAYDLYVQGTFSFWPPEIWPRRGPVLTLSGPPEAAVWEPPVTFRRHGTPEPAPMFASAGGPSGPVGVDAEFAFALIQVPGSDFPRFPLPKRVTAFEIDLGSGWHHPRPDGAPLLRPAPGHLYRYVVVGQGAPLRVRLVDDPVEDNYGALVIRVTAHDPGARPLRLLPRGTRLTRPAASPFRAAPAAGIFVPRHEASRRVLRPRRDPRAHEPGARARLLRPQPAGAAGQRR